MTTTCLTPKSSTLPSVGRTAAVGAAAVLLLAVLAGISLFVGVSDVSPRDLVSADPQTREQAWEITRLTRVPRTVALVLTGMSMAVTGMLMQMLARNRFVEPSTAGTVESAGLGIVVATLAFPTSPVIVKMLIATAFALAGTALFLSILRRLPLRDIVIVPLVGIMLGGIVGAAATFLAYRANLLQSLGAWTSGDFSMVMEGRYEQLWAVGALTIVAYVVADRFTVAGLGQQMSTSLGLDFRKVTALGLALVAVTVAVVVVTVGAIPFLGLVVPNLVSRWRGDNLRRSLPWVAWGGAVLVLGCDLLARTVRHPYEIPLGVVVGVLGSAVFLVLLLRSPDV